MIKVHMRVNAAGLPMRSDITQDQTSDCLSVDLVLDDTQPEPCVPVADHGYDPDKVRKTTKAGNLLLVDPMHKSRRLRVVVVRSLNRMPNLVRRCFNKPKNVRRVATRYDKTTESFRCFTDITSIRLWL